MNDIGKPPKKAFITQWAWLTRVSMDWLEKGIAPPDFNSPSQDSAHGADEITGRYGTTGAASRGATVTAIGEHNLTVVAPAEAA